MRLLKKKEKKNEDIEEKESTRSARREKKVVTVPPKPRDSTRWLSLLFLIIFLFMAYLSWVAFQA